MQIWHRIRLLPDSGADYKNTVLSKPESDVDVIERMNLRLVDDKLIIVYFFSCFIVATSLSAMRIFGARNFHSRRIRYQTKFSNFLGRNTKISSAKLYVHMHKFRTFPWFK